MGRVEQIESGNVTAVDLDRPMPELQEQLSGLSVGDRVSLTGTVVVARDIVHANLRERLDSGGELPEDRKSTRLNSSHVSTSYAVFCLKKKNANSSRR